LIFLEQNQRMLTFPMFGNIAPLDGNGYLSTAVADKSGSKDMMGMYKQFVTNVHTNPALDAFLFHVLLIQLQDGLVKHGDKQWHSFKAVVRALQLSILDAIVNSMVKVAFAKIHGNNFEEDETTALA
jgi:hypothetical protein